VNIEKLIKKLPTGFVDEAARLGDAELKAAVIQSEVNIREVERERDADEKLQGAKALVKDLGGPYRDAVGAQRAKIAYLMHLMEERGTLPASDTEE
jgi:hypothetical protein